jgi:hypothetical protein
MESRGDFEGSGGGSLDSTASDTVGFLGFCFGGNDEWVNRTVIPSDSGAPRRLLSTNDINRPVLVSNEDDL